MIVILLTLFDLSFANPFFRDADVRMQVCRAYSTFLPLNQSNVSLIFFSHHGNQRFWIRSLKVNNRKRRSKNIGFTYSTPNFMVRPRAYSFLYNSNRIRLSKVTWNLMLDTYKSIILSFVIVQIKIFTIWLS